MGRHRKDGQLPVLRVASQQPGGFVPVHDRHLQVHQHHVVIRHRAGAKHFKSLLAIRGDIHMGAVPLHQFDNQLLIDRMVLHQQHSETGKVVLASPRL